MQQLRTLKQHWRQRVLDWQLARLKPADNVVLGRRTIYILPTAQGVFLGLSLLAMFIACINYQLNLAYLVLFLVLAVALGGMHRTHQNLMHLRLSLIVPAAQQAGQIATVSLTLEKNSAYALELTLDEAVVYVPHCAQQQTVMLHTAPQPRGVYALRPITIATQYPLGLWRAWAVWLPLSPVSIYPAPLRAEIAANEVVDQANNPALSAKPSVHGDALSHIESSDAARMKNIDWRALSRDKLAIKQLEQTDTGLLLCFDIAQLQGDKESRLAQLAYLIEEAQTQGQPFQLQLGAVQSPMGSGVSHLDSCRKLLAAA